MGCEEEEEEREKREEERREEVEVVEAMEPVYDWDPNEVDIALERRETRRRCCVVSKSLFNCEKKRKARRE